MSAEGQKPWTREEIIEHSSHWTLACDSALLTTLESFADNLMAKSKEINNNLISLTNKLEETALELHLARNKFHSLKNTQFIESRVYEDDETIPDTSQNKQEEPVDEVDHSECIKQAALKGLEMLDKYFDKVEVTVSDSEDDDSNMPNYILHRKDLYIDRPLPYVIGTEEWYRSTKVGLESSSESENEKQSDYSESEEEDNNDRNGVDSQIDQKSESSPSETEFNHRDEPSSTSTNFAEELARKLGNVVTCQEPEIVNTQPIKPPNTSKYAEPFFGEEPPPLEEKAGLFSQTPSRGLFDDEESDREGYVTPPIAKQNKGLFNEKPGILTENVISKPPLLSEEPPDLVPDQKKPTGGISIIGGGKVFDKKFLRRQSSSEDESWEESPKKPTPVPNVHKNETKKPEDLFAQDFDDQPPPSDVKTSLFDDDLFKDDLFSTTVTKVTSLFDDDDNVTEPPVVKNDGKVGDLFGDQDDVTVSCESKEPERKLPKSYDDLFGSSPETTNDLFADVITKPMLFQTSPFDSEPPPLFDEPIKTIPTHDNRGKPKDKPVIPSRPIEAPSTSHKPNFDIFGDSPPKDDLFASPKHTTNTSEKVPRVTEYVKIEPERDIADVKPETRKIPGKLNVNLAINVAALKPNSRPPKIKDEEVTETVRDVQNDIKAEEVKREAKSVQNDGVEILKSVTKDRVRVPSVKRRPSTRQGRKNALKHSQQKNHSENISIETQVREVTEDTNQQPTSLFGGDDEATSSVPKDDQKRNVLFEKDTVDLEKSEESGSGLNQKGLFEEQTSAISTARDLFGDVEATSSAAGDEQKINSILADESYESGTESNPKGLFDDQISSTTKMVEPDIKKTSLFEDDDDDDLFSSKSRFSEKKSSENANIPKIEGLFTDENDGDIFSTPPFLPTRTQEKPPEPKQTKIFDDEVEDIFENPPALPTTQVKPKQSSLFDDEDEGLFGKKSSVLPTTSKNRKSLFDDEDDDDDELFKSSLARSTKRTQVRQATERKIPKTEVKKLGKTQQVDDDPLSLFK